MQWLVLVLAVLANLAFGFHFTPNLVPISPPLPADGPAAPAINTVYEFPQLIDHANPSAGTFQMRYWMNAQYYKPGGPVILFTPGESAADQYTGYLQNRTLTGVFAQTYGGVAVLIEHRYWGTSNPTPDLSTYGMRYLTANQSLEDLAYFARNVQLPFSNGSHVGPTAAPWILVGGSYSGVLAAWAKQAFGDLFWVGYSTSGPVQPIWDYWQYWVSVKDGLPKNCSADTQAVISHVDSVLNSGNQADITALKTMFGLQNVTHNDDFASALTLIQGRWQDQQAYSGPGGVIFQWCDAMEVHNGIAAGPQGQGLDIALPAWAKFFNATWPSVCGTNNSWECFDSYTNIDWLLDTSLGQGYRPWFYYICSEFGYWQAGAPQNETSIVSNLVTDSYMQRQCQIAFPPDSRVPPLAPRAWNAEVTRQYMGWNLESNRLWVTNAGLDPWREASISSDYGPHEASTQAQPIAVIPDGIHCWDLIIKNTINPNVASVINAATLTIQQWINEFKPTVRPDTKRETPMRWDRKGV